MKLKMILAVLTLAASLTTQAADFKFCIDTAEMVKTVADLREIGVKEVDVYAAMQQMNYKILDQKSTKLMTDFAYRKYSKESPQDLYENFLRGCLSH